MYYMNFGSSLERVMHGDVIMNKPVCLLFISISRKKMRYNFYLIQPQNRLISITCYDKTR